MFPVIFCLCWLYSLWEHALLSTLRLVCQWKRTQPRTVLRQFYVTRLKTSTCWVCSKAPVVRGNSAARHTHHQPKHIIWMQNTTFNSELTHSIYTPIQVILNVFSSCQLLRTFNALLFYCCQKADNSIFWKKWNSSRRLLIDNFAPMRISNGCFSPVYFWTPATECKKL